MENEMEDGFTWGYGDTWAYGFAASRVRGLRLIGCRCQGLG